MKWKSKFEGVVDQFEAHKKNLLADVQLYTSIIATRTHELLASEFTNMKAMVSLAFDRMQTHEERELAAFAQKNGGAERILENGKLTMQFLDMEKRVSTKDDKGPTSGKSGAPTRSGLTPAELKKEMSKDVDTVLEENTKAFDVKFGAIELSLREVNKTIQRQSDRVISEVLAGMHDGPHERIKDQVCNPEF